MTLLRTAWKTASGLNTPVGRDHHGAVWTGTEMIIWGGNIYSVDHRAYGRAIQPINRYLEIDQGRWLSRNP